MISAYQQRLYAEVWRHIHTRRAGRGGRVYIADMKLLSPGLRSPRPPNLHTITLVSWLFARHGRSEQWQNILM